MPNHRATGANLPLLTLHDRVAAHGSCVGRMPNDREPFFDEYRPLGRYGPSKQRARARTACAGCPVQHECLELALRHERSTGWSWGYWGATSPDERRAMIAVREDVDDVVDDVARVLIAMHGEHVDLDALPAELRRHLVVLGLVLVHQRRADASDLAQQQLLLTWALTPPGEHSTAPARTGHR